MADKHTLDRLYQLVLDRRKADPNESYVAKRFKQGTGKISQKFGEEAVETIVAALQEDKDEVISESADMIFHWLLLLADADVDPQEVMAELESRMGISGLDEKALRQMKEKDKRVNHMSTLDNQALDIIFRNARSFSFWQDKPVEDALLHKTYDLMKWGPTAANSCPARICFVKSNEAKEKLKPCLDKGNIEKSMTAPVVAVLAYDMEFYENMGKLFPHNPGAREWYAGKQDVIKNTAFRNGTLQAAYFMIAARALGLDCGPMSGFNNAKLDEAFFAGTAWKSNFICALGYGERSKLFPRGPRLEFSEACRID